MSVWDTPGAQPDESTTTQSKRATHTTTASAEKKKTVTLTPMPIVGPHTGGAGLLLRF